MCLARFFTACYCNQKKKEFTACRLGFAFCLSFGLVSRGCKVSSKGRATAKNFGFIFYILLIL